MDSINQIDTLVPFLKFMAEVLGPDAEIVLYNVAHKNVHFVINPFDEEMILGSPMRSLERDFLERSIYMDTDYIVNYRAMSKSKNKLKSATYFFKDKFGIVYGILTVNIKVDRLIELRNIINEMISGTHAYDNDMGKSFYDSFDISIEGLMENTIIDEVSKFTVPPDRLSYQEKMQLIKNLDEKGVFLVKGSIAELATLMKTTETSVYRYINKLSEE